MVLTHKFVASAAPAPSVLKPVLLKAANARKNEKKDKKHVTFHRTRQDPNWQPPADERPPADEESVSGSVVIRPDATNRPLGTVLERINSAGDAPSGTVLVKSPAAANANALPAPAASAALCPACGKRVYAQESVAVLSKSFHRSCLRCNVCAHLLTPSRALLLNDKLYCPKDLPKRNSLMKTPSGSPALAPAVPAPASEPSLPALVQKAAPTRELALRSLRFLLVSLLALFLALTLLAASFAYYAHMRPQHYFALLNRYPALRALCARIPELFPAPPAPAAPPAPESWWASLAKSLQQPRMN